MASPATEVNINVEVATYCVVGTEKEVDGKPTVVFSFATEKSAQKMVERGEGEILISQSFEMPNAANEAGTQELVKSEKERVRLFNRGLDQKLYQVVRARMLETDEAGNLLFNASEGATSLRKEAAEEVAARATSPEAKIEKILDNLEPAAAAAILAKLQARASQS